MTKSMEGRDRMPFRKLMLRSMACAEPMIYLNIRPNQYHPTSFQETAKWTVDSSLPSTQNAICYCLSESDGLATLTEPRDLNLRGFDPEIVRMLPKQATSGGGCNV
jgi:hypothetical protein